MALAAAVLFLAFDNLGGRLLWGDEAETATLAKNVLKFGVPRVDDGLNHISQHGDQYDARDGIWTWSPWLQEYITAGSFAIFGTNTWAARAPFALIGWLAVILLGVVAWKIYKSHHVSLAAMFLLGTSETYLLNIRQCRYYSITVLAEILVIYGIYLILSKNQRGPWWIFGGLTVMFYCNYTLAAANVPILLALAGVLFWQERRSAWALIICLGGCFLMFAPWLIYTEAWRQSHAEGRHVLKAIIWFYLLRFHFCVLPWCFLLLPLGSWLARRLRKGATVPPIEKPVAHLEKYLVLLPVFYIPILLVMPAAELRYLMPLLPVTGLLLAAWLFRYLKGTVLAVAVLMLQCLTNVVAVATNPLGEHFPLRAPLVDFVVGNDQPYQDRFTDVLKFLNDRAHPGDVILSWYPELPLIFYGHYRVLDGRLPMPDGTPMPEWFLPQSLSSVFETRRQYLPDVYKSYYGRVVVPVHDSPRNADVPDPTVYQYQMTETMTSFAIYKLKSPADTTALPQ